MKKCNKCLDIKELDSFNIDKSKKDGYMNICKKCRSDKHTENKDLNNQKSKEYYLNNKEKISKRSKKYNDNNKEKLAIIWKKYRTTNKTRYNKQKLEYESNRRKSDPLYKLKGNIRTLITKTIKDFGYVKKSKSYDILGCTFEEFKIHIENQFTEGMNWDNHGSGQDKWNFDHKIPVSWAKDEDELLRLNHYTNYQPMWSCENILKSNKWSTL